MPSLNKKRQGCVSLRASVKPLIEDKATMAAYLEFRSVVQVRANLVTLFFFLVSTLARVPLAVALESAKEQLAANKSEEGWVNSKELRGFMDQH